MCIPDKILKNMNKFDSDTKISLSLRMRTNGWGNHTIENWAIKSYLDENLTIASLGTKQLLKK